MGRNSKQRGQNGPTHKGDKQHGVGRELRAVPLVRAVCGDSKTRTVGSGAGEVGRGETWDPCPTLDFGPGLVHVESHLKI